MRISTPMSSGSTVFTPSSNTLNASISANSQNSHNPGVGSVPTFADTPANKNGVSTAQVRTNSPSLHLPVTSKNWSSNMSDSFGGTMLESRPASVGTQDPVMRSQTTVVPTGNHQVKFGVAPAAQSSAGLTEQLPTVSPVNKVLQMATSRVDSPRQNTANSVAMATTKQLVRTSTTQPLVVQRTAQPGSAQMQSPITIPPGMVLARSQNGQLLLVNSNSLPNALASSATTSPAAQPPVSGTLVSLKSSTTAAVSLSQNRAAGQSVTSVTPAVSVSKVPATQAPPTQSGQSVALSQEDVVNVSKCRNFLTTLIKLASAGGQSVTTVNNVKKLVQDLIDDKIEPEYFTQQLQIELNSAPQPYLVPFLKRSLPLLRLTMMQQSGSTGTVPVAVAAAAIRASYVPSSTTSTVIPGNTASTPKTTTTMQKKMQTKPKVISKKNSVPDIRLPRVLTTPIASNQRLNQRHASPTQMPAGVASRGASSMLLAPAAVGTSRHVAQRWAGTSSGGTFRDDDDINDVASMAGVNLSEESARILATNSELVGSQVRSCQDTTVINSAALTRKMSEIVSKHPYVKQINPEVIKFTAYAAEARIKDLIEKVSLVAFHRTANIKENEHYEAAQDVKSQLKFLLQLDQLEKKRHAESEREILMRAMKSRSKNEDPEQLRLKQRAKEFQQWEMEKMQIRNADETARNAIGPRRKKLKVEAAAGGGATESKDVTSSLRSSTLRPPRIKRVNIRDLIFVMEHEKGINKSKLLYKSYLK